MSSDADRPDSEGHSQSAPIDRRSFNAAVGAGAVGTALHQLLGAPASAAQAARQGASELCEMTAVDLVGRLRKKEVSAREVMSAHLTQIEHVNSKVNAIVTLVAEQAMANAARADDTLARGGAAGVLHGLARGAQGPRGHGRNSNDSRVTVLPGQHPVPRRAHRHEDSRRGRDHCRQDEYTGIGSGIPDVQCRVRGNAESVRSDEDVRRQQRRGGDGPGLPHAADRRWQRHRRIAPKSARLLQRCRAAPLARPRGERVHFVVAVGCLRSDREDGRGCGAVPQRHCRVRSPVPAFDSGRRRALQRSTREESQGRARRMVAWSGRNPVRARNPARRRRQPQGLRGHGLRCRRGGT